MSLRPPVLFLISVLFVVDASAAPAAAERCRTRKIAATGRFAAETLRCAARAIRVGAPSLPECLGRVESRLARAFANADAGTTCRPELSTARMLATTFGVALLDASQPTPTPAPTATPPAATGCGNGVVELGEQCDGQSFCTGSCRFALPTVCCGPTGFCIEGEFPTLADICFLQGQPWVLGALCAPAEPGCDPTSGCAGTCVSEATFAATSICCDTAAGCTDATIDDTMDLWGFVFQGCLQAGGTAGLGTCAAPSCLPGG